MVAATSGEAPKADVSKPFVPNVKYTLKSRLIVPISKVSEQGSQNLKDVKTRIIDGEVCLIFPSVAASHKLHVQEWSNVKLVLTEKRQLKMAIAISAILPIVMGFIFIFFVYIDDGSFAKTDTLSLAAYVVPVFIGTAVVFPLLISAFQPYHVLTFDAAKDEITAQKGYILGGLRDLECHRFSELAAVAAHEHDRYVFRRGYMKFLAITLQFPRGMRIFQTVDTVEESKKHAAWIAETGQALACAAIEKTAVKA